MTEAPRRHPAIESVYRVVQSVDPGATQALNQAKDFFQLLAKDSQLSPENRPQREVPEVFDTIPLFQHPLKELGSEYVLKRLRAAVETAHEDESRKAELLREAEKKEGKKRKPVDAQVVFMVHNPTPPPEETREAETGIDIFIDEVREESIVELVLEEPKPPAKKTTSTRTPKQSGQRSPREPFVPPDGYIRSANLKERFPDLSGIEIVRLKKSSSMLNKGRGGGYYLEADMLKQVAVIRKEKEHKKQEAEVAKAARAERKPEAFTRPEGYISRAEALKEEQQRLAEQREKVRAEIILARKEAIREKREQAARENAAKKNEAIQSIATIKGLAAQYGLSRSIIREILRTEPFTNRRNQRIYSRADAEHKIEKYVGEGTRWVRLGYFTRIYGISYIKLHRALADVSTMKGIHNETLYDREKAEELLAPYIKTATIDKDTGFYTDQNNQAWGSESTIATVLGLTVDELKRFLNPDNTLPIRRPNKKVLVGYNLIETRLAAQEYLSLPTEQEYLDAHPDESLIEAAALSEEYDCSSKSVHGALKSMLLELRGTGTHKQYPETRARETLDAIIVHPEIDADASTYTDEQGVVYESRYTIQERLRMNRTTINKILKQGLVGTTVVRKGLTTYTFVHVGDLEEHKKKFNLKQKS